MKLSIVVSALSPYIFAILSVALLFIGYRALPIYCGLAIVIYPVLVAMLATEWENKGLIYRESTLADVDFYIHGIYVKEQERHLKNLLFVSPDIMQAKLITLTRIKLIICVAMFTLSLYELVLQAKAQSTMLTVNMMAISDLVIGLCVALFLGHCMRKSLALYAASRYRNYVVQFYDTPEVQLCTAAIPAKEKNLQVTHTRFFDAILAWH